MPLRAGTMSACSHAAACSEIVVAREVLFILCCYWGCFPASHSGGLAELCLSLFFSQRCVCACDVALIGEACDPKLFFSLLQSSRGIVSAHYAVYLHCLMALFHTVWCIEVFCCRWVFYQLSSALVLPSCSLLE